MASRAEIKGLPETLPENFGDWDNEPTPVTVPRRSDSREAARRLGDVPKPSAPPPEPEVTPQPVAERLRGAPLPSPERAYAEDRAALHRQTSSTHRTARGRSSVPHAEEAVPPAHEVPEPRLWANASLPEDLSDVIAIPAAAGPSPDEFVRQLLRPKIAATRDEKHTSKKWMMVAAVSACSILVLVILAIWLFRPGTLSTVKNPAAPELTATEAQAQPNNSTPKPSPSTPSTQHTVPTATQTQLTAESQPAEADVEDTPPEVQSKMMNDQLTAPTRIPQDIKKPAGEIEPPPPAGFGATGTDALGGGSAIPSVFNGQARPIVHAAPSAITISAGVATGMLVQKTMPIYPAMAKAAHVSGTVEIQATISKTGTIKDMHVVNGPVMLRQAALDAVRSWRYKPYKLNNEPTEVQTTVNVIFTLGG